MPLEKNIFGGTKRFRVRAFDEDNKELDQTSEIEAQKSDKESETIIVPEEDSMMELRTTSNLIFLQVEHAGMMGGKVIGRCQIHRLDPRCSQIWPYALNDLDGNEIKRGIELKVVEHQPPVIPVSGPFGTGRPGSIVGPNSPFTPHTSTSTSRQLGAAGINDMNHGVSAMFEFDRATDLPLPTDVSAKEVVLTIIEDEHERELQRLGPFKAFAQKGGQQLLMAECKGARVFAHAPLHFGGHAKEGAMFVRVAISYMRDSGALDLIGITEPIKVTWRPETKKYYEIRRGRSQVLGGVYLTHRLMTEGEIATGAAPGIPSTASRRQQQMAGPREMYQQLSGRTGNFPLGSPEEAFEQAAINAEAQNRALLQHCKVVDPHSHENAPHVRVVNGYREWDSLDSLFRTMGPNPLAQCEDLGATVTRAYSERTSVLRELIPKLRPAMSPTDEQLNLNLIEMMYGQDPKRVEQALRPLLCKDPEEIAATKDMKWCPDPPIYAPLRNMDPQDKQLLRLACYDPTQNAKLMFADVNPNYRINEDIWGVLADYKTARSLLVQKPDAAHRRVKDECIMA
jgi:hypothetical protein